MLMMARLLLAVADATANELTYVRVQQPVCCCWHSWGGCVCKAMYWLHMPSAASTCSRHLRQAGLGSDGSMQCVSAQAVCLYLVHTLHCDGWGQRQPCVNACNALCGCSVQDWLRPQAALCCRWCEGSTAMPNAGHCGLVEAGCCCCEQPFVATYGVVVFVWERKTSCTMTRRQLYASQGWCCNCVIVARCLGLCLAAAAPASAFMQCMPASVDRVLYKNTRRQ